MGPKQDIPYEEQLKEVKILETERFTRIMTAFFIFDRQSSRGWIKFQLSFPLEPCSSFPCL